MEPGFKALVEENCGLAAQVSALQGQLDTQRHDADGLQRIREGAISPEEADAICRELSEAAKAHAEAKEAARAVQVERDGLEATKHGLEDSLRNEQEACRILRYDLEGSKDRQGMLSLELDALKKELAQQNPLAQGHEGKIAQLQEANEEASS